MYKLTPDREAEIRQLIAAYAAYQADRITPPQPQLATTYAPELLAELDRLRPTWVPVAASQHRYGHTYDLAGTTQASPVPVWIGKGHYDANWDRWVDANDLKPFPASTTILYFLKTLSPPELIGQPKV